MVRRPYPYSLSIERMNSSLTWRYRNGEFTGTDVGVPFGILGFIDQIRPFR
jgi:hypothetical protein